MTLLAAAADVAGGVVAVASRWDVIAAAFVGGLTREVLAHRGDARRMRQAIESAVSRHAAECPAAKLALEAGGKCK